jgi:hypothetical protein
MTFALQTRIAEAPRNFTLARPAALAGSLGVVVGQEEDSVAQEGAVEVVQEEVVEVEEGIEGVKPRDVTNPYFTKRVTKDPRP